MHFYESPQVALGVRSTTFRFFCTTDVTVLMRRIQMMRLDLLVSCPEPLSQMEINDILAVCSKQTQCGEEVHHSAGLARLSHSPG